MNGPAWSDQVRTNSRQGFGMNESYGLQKKIERQRRVAPLELQKTRLCANVVLALVGGADDLTEPLRALKAEIGPNWALVTAFQFMSGRQARLAAECAADEERPALMLAHQVAEAMSWSPTPISRASLAELRVAAATTAAELRAATRQSK